MSINQNQDILKLTCPVCEAKDIISNSCPNCETDLSSIRILQELPIQKHSDIKSKSNSPVWIPIAIALFPLIIIGSLLIIIARASIIIIKIILGALYTPQNNKVV